MSVIGVIILIGQRISVGTSIVTALPGMVMLILAAMTAMIIKDLFPKSIFPAFGFATIIGLLLSMPYSPTSEVFLTNTNNINFMAITTPLLAFAGISVGNKIEALKEMSWKIVIISLIVFTTIFFACASIAHIVLSIQGKI
ncbi:putative membrane protein [Clostridioides difficile CD69]|nr:putative membrane protein [Clostridioides difficile CD69]